MKYVLAAMIGALAGGIAGAVLGVPFMLWGPGSNDPLAGLWVICGALGTAPAGIVVALALTWGTPRRRFVAGTFPKPAGLGAVVAVATALALLNNEAHDEWFNLLVFAGMGAGAGVLTSLLLRSPPPPPRRYAARTGDGASG
jgi:hypothetical protein